MHPNQVNPAAWDASIAYGTSLLYFFRITFNAALTSATSELWACPVSDPTTYQILPFHFHTTSSGLYCYRLPVASAIATPAATYCLQTYLPFSAQTGLLTSAAVVESTVALPELLSTHVASPYNLISAHNQYYYAGQTGSQGVSEYRASRVIQSLSSITCFNSASASFVRSSAPVAQDPYLGQHSAAVLTSMSAPGASAAFSYRASAGLNSLRLAFKSS